MKNYSYKEYGNQLRFSYCPICKKEGKNPDFSFNKETRQFFCHREGRYGRLSDLKNQDKDFYNFLNKMLKGGNREERRKVAKNPVNLKNIIIERGSYFLNQQWRDYLKTRGIGEKYLDKLFR